ncbi:MAG TPA: alpha/beta fold hydrolase [Nannocystaceae bacterium]|nr:alpha/beta fold hydrolase [Nannocystaceae bacterium]
MRGLAALVVALGCGTQSVRHEPASAPVEAVDRAQIEAAPATAERRAALPQRTLERVKADDGHELALHAKVPAQPKGAILLLHGRTWSGVPDFDLAGHSTMDALAMRGWAAYALDLRGYGSTPRDASGWCTPDRAAKDLATALARIAEHHPDLPKPAVLGWSLGSLVAQLQAQREPASMSALVLYGYPRDPDNPGKGGAGPPASATPPQQQNTAASAASDFISPAVIDKATIDAYVEAALAADPVRADWRAFDQFDALDPAKVHVRTLVIHGARDPFARTRDHAKLMSRLGTSDRAWVSIAAGDHAAHLEATSAAFLHAVLAFLEQPRTDEVFDEPPPVRAR